MKPDWKQTLHTYLLMTLGTARVSVSFRTGGMHLSAEALLAELRRQPTVVDIRRGV